MEGNPNNPPYGASASTRGTNNWWRGRRGRGRNAGWRPPNRGNFHRNDSQHPRNYAESSSSGSNTFNERNTENGWWRRRDQTYSSDGNDREHRRGGRPNHQSQGQTFVRPQVDTHHTGNAATNSYPHRRGQFELTGYHTRLATTSSNGIHLTEKELGTQRERLTEELSRGTCDCIICFERIVQYERIWNCTNCYQVFHLSCIKKWVNSSLEKLEEGWRCPGCQYVFDTKPYQYLCFCGKEENPEWNRSDTWRIPHSCGEQCLKRRRQNDCPHPCTLLCHPGPCPPCGIYVSRRCFCGLTTRQTRCSDGEQIGCGKICDNTLKCGLHKCQRNCHPDDEHLCDEILLQTCFCGKHNRSVECDKEVAGSGSYSCGDVCDQPLKCGNHKCGLLCHSEECPACQLIPELVTHCPCGKSRLKDLKAHTIPRVSCTDSLPTCTNICGKILSCGAEDDRHTCSVTCHVGPCPPCTLTTLIRCNCGSRKQETKCVELTNELVVRCKKRCNKLKTCSRHRCNQSCCTDIQHRCDLICGQKLSCNLHRCDRLCHLGNCPPCQNTSFNELSCHCGSSIMYPPIPCGTQPPECQQPCQRQQNCEHPHQHRCHSDPECPPCTVLTAKWCYGGHELRSCIPCFQNDVCCGLPCDRPLSCGRHMCSRRCHSGPCESDGVICTQPCPNPRSECGHPCLLTCHDGECPQSTCKSMVTISCRCGRRSGSVHCAENLSIYNRMVAMQLSSDMVNEEKLQRTRTLECDGECALMERNRRLALALQIRNPDLTNKLRPPTYSEFLKDQAKKSPEFVSQVYQQFTQLVQNAKESKQKTKSHAFPPMKSDHRRIIHELAEFFGCETQSYDQEPKKNVVATAFKDKSWLPSTSLISVAEGGTSQRFAGRAPPPVPHCSSRRDVHSVESHEKTSQPAIDYFDYAD